MFIGKSGHRLHGHQTVLVQAHRSTSDLIENCLHMDVAVQKMECDMLKSKVSSNLENGEHACPGR